jgi:hydrogenase expression/formation protein HypD
MKYLEEYRQKDQILAYVDKIKTKASKKWGVMEICGGQTHSLLKYGIDRLLQEQVQLIHGPGCPVCVTPAFKIDQAIDLSLKEDVIFCSFGDMLRVPGSRSSLLEAKGQGADIRIVYGPLDAVTIASENPAKQVVFFAVGFETTAPINALAVIQAKTLGLVNFKLLVSHVLVPPAVSALCVGEHRIDGLLAAGHVCSIQGEEEYLELNRLLKLPIVMTGFEPLDLVQGLYWMICQLEEGRCEVENQYSRTVASNGNPQARAAVEEVFKTCDLEWRGLGAIQSSGLRLRDEYADYDAARYWRLEDQADKECPDCRSGEVLQGNLVPSDCPYFGKGCTPDQPMGATMVSSEGACHAYFLYGEAHA